MSENFEIVWLEDERTFAELIKRDAFTSVLRYTREGIDYEIVVFNDEYHYIEGDDIGDDDEG